MGIIVIGHSGTGLAAGIREAIEKLNQEGIEVITIDDYRFNRTFSTSYIISRGCYEMIDDWNIDPPNNNQKNPRMSQFIRDRIDVQNRKADRKKQKR